MPMTQVNDQDNSALIERASKGDRAAFEILFKRYYPALFRFTTRFVPEQEAEEFAADVFCKMLEDKASFHASGKAAFFTWLCAVARNRAIDYLRRPSSVVAEAALEAESMEQLIGEAPSVAHQLEMQQDAEAIRYCMSKLPEEQRASLLLVYWRDASLAEASAELLCPEGTIKSRMSAARAALKKCVINWLNGGRHVKRL